MQTHERTPLEIQFTFLKETRRSVHLEDMLHNLCFVFHESAIVS